MQASISLNGSSAIVETVKPSLVRAFQELCHLILCRIEGSSGPDQVEMILKSCRQSLLTANEAITKRLLVDSESSVLELTATIGKLEVTKKELEKKRAIGSQQVVNLICQKLIFQASSNVINTI